MFKFLNRAVHPPPSLKVARGPELGGLLPRALPRQWSKIPRSSISNAVARKRQPSSSKQSAPQPLPNNDKDHASWPDVWKTGFDNLYSLAQSGNIYGIVALFLVLPLPILSYRLPSESLLKLTMFLLDEHNYILYLLLALLFLSLFANYLQWRTYVPQIKEIAQQRTDVIRGIQSGELTSLKDVQSSKLDLESGQPLISDPKELNQ
jgi:hypothetical protein